MNTFFFLSTFSFLKKTSSPVSHFINHLFFFFFFFSLNESISSIQETCMIVIYIYNFPEQNAPDPRGPAIPLCCTKPTCGWWTWGPILAETVYIYMCMIKTNQTKKNLWKLGNLMIWEMGTFSFLLLWFLFSALWFLFLSFIPYSLTSPPLPSLTTKEKHTYTHSLSQLLFGAMLRFKFQFVSKGACFLKQTPQQGIFFYDITKTEFWIYSRVAWLGGDLQVQCLQQGKFNPDERVSFSSGDGMCTANLVN